MEKELSAHSSQIADLKDQSKESLQLLLDTIEGINRTVELKSLMAESMEATRIVMKSEASSLMLLDKDTGELFVSLPTGPVKEDIKGKSIPRHKGIGGWVVENRKPFLSNKVEESDIFWGDLSDEFTTKNILCVPLITKENEVIGVLQAINRRRNEDFTAHDIPVFQALASHVSSAIERTRQIEELHSRLKEKEVMLTETHHRVKNNLSVIAGLIEMELPSVTDDSAKDLLQTTYTRIQSMMRVHDLLCEKGLFKDIELGLYLKQLAEQIEKTMSDFPKEIKIDLNAENIHLQANKALLCGIVLNELLVNIFKHGFEGMDKGRILIDLRRDSDQVKLDISDNGVGLPDDFEVRSGKTIGMWIIDVMLKKLDGTIEFENNDDGSHFQLTFPVEN
ncbi:GAF domain-containing protein [Aliifodinibius sp. S!AR15-10]|uniref:histidine kinase dimerization/phosphoacceptor domain -containing protein n=1 Tax=Aliifodinibius sp. S!AR15-10 TaxID=2950437 RepID=UPI00285ADCE4|nr:histidine kinase dimerization/phosphoacceptor domain -containing protein [Aliifodinibius sp. S!AR15-10]MDR8394113.1 GAF domain-containing protein [Aliifodinibius sp. S!AR15-10]